MNVEELNVLSTADLWREADRLGLELPLALERPFVIGEILEAYEDEDSASGEEEREEKESKARDVAHPILDNGRARASLEDTRYNESSVFAMLKDPAWAYMYWDIKEEERQSPNEAEPRLFSIRVLELSSPIGASQNAISWFEFSIDAEDRDWYVHLPDDGSCYIFELAYTQAKVRKVLARSNILQVPRLKDAGAFGQLSRSRRRMLEYSDLKAVIEREEGQSSGFRLTPSDGEE